MNIIVLCLLVLVFMAMACVWWTPKSAEYVSEILWRRACALQTSRVVYQRVYEEENIGSYLDDAVNRHTKLVCGPMAQEDTLSVAKNPALASPEDLEMLREQIQMVNQEVKRNIDEFIAD